MSIDASPWIAAVRSSHDHLRDLAAPLSGEQLTAMSYASEWSIAQVLSHLGSQAEIFDLFLDSALSGGEAPGGDRFGPIWDRWNAKKPDEQASDALAADTAFVERVEGLGEEERALAHLDLFGRELDLAGLLGMRLAEHALHTWDIAGALPDTAVLPQDAVDLLVDALGPLAGRAGRPSGKAETIEIATTGPDRRFQLTTGPDEVTLTSAEAATASTGGATLPAEAFVRLVYGRLDPAHTPDVQTVGVDLDALRAVFPGF